MSRVTNVVGTDRVFKVSLEQNKQNHKDEGKKELNENYEKINEKYDYAVAALNLVEKSSLNRNSKEVDSGGRKNENKHDNGNNLKRTHTQMTNRIVVKDGVASYINETGMCYICKKSPINFPPS